MQGEPSAIRASGMEPYLEILMIPIVYSSRKSKLIGFVPHLGSYSPRKMMELKDTLTPECMLVPMEATDKSDAIRQLVHLLAEKGKCHDEEELLKAVFDREAIRSTGIGQGLAVPHGKCNSCDRLIMALGKPAEPIDFDSKDGQPVDIVVLMASPLNQTGPHIQALARISRLMQMATFRTAISQAQSADEVHKLIADAEI